ncbi:AAA family ATPase [Chloroflexota bacterium]
MIPIKLAVRNFMPYRDDVPPLYFTDIHTASIWGENGNGKSALIDAITWALWGKTRAKSDDDLIHADDKVNEMEVEFDFAVGQQTYRVIRRHARPKGRRASGQSSLDLLIASDGNFKLISGNSIRETEKKIIDTLHMDYDTFINSAFLRQGHADEFTQQPPAKRKEVLANILGLSVYDELEEQAKEFARQQETEKTLAESAIRDIADELAQRPAYEAELEQAQGELLRVEKVLKERETKLNELRQKKELLENKKSQLAQLEKHIAETTRNLGTWDEQIKQHHSRINDYEELISRRTDIEEGYTRFVETKKLSDELDQKLRFATTLNERKHKLEIAIMQSSQALLKEHALAENRIGELEASYRKLPQLKSELQQVQAELKRLAVEEESLKQKRQTEQQLRASIHSLEADKSRLKQEIAEMEEKLNLLLAEGGAKCPLCGTELGTDGIKHIEGEYAAEKQKKSDLLNSKQSELVQKQTGLKSAIDEISRLETGINQGKTSAQSRASLLEREIEEVEKAGGRLEEERVKISEIEERLAGKDFAAGEQETLSKLEGELARLDYDSQQHEQVRQGLASLEKYEEPKRRLDEADRLISQEKEAATSSEQAARELRRSLEGDNQTRQALAMEINSFPEVDGDLAQAETEYQGLSVQQRQVQERVGSIKGKLQRFSELETRVKEKEKSLALASKEELIYRDLAQAFGKKGVQAWLIEMALPEIEAEANKLLGRMTDNRMHVTMEPQRQTKKGDTVETLDIKIADELGTRNYEMFSGGEAFRINFAIRIGLSKLLARRAGAPLPTLIIDEGFGTQDSTGLEKIKEAITSIQDDFKMILVITHIEELRDAFPTRIGVTKTARGATIEVG